MNILLPGYQLIESLNEGVKTIVYRGVRQSDSQSVVIKTLKAEHPTLEDITRLRHEYKILKSLNIEGVVKTYALENYHNGLALVLEDFREISLKSFIASQKTDLIFFLKTAIQLARTLGELHQHQVIHKDIKPHNILINPNSCEIRLIDFSIATRLSRETQALGNPTLLEGTLAYMSPEQTGRMNRSLDYRTDFYSLGVTFYEILTGQLPFTTTDPMELVHSHIAKQPVPPHQLNPEFPKVVSDIVMKLLAKNAEDRYQSAFGLQVDLEECLFLVRTSGKIEDFTPGKRDKSGQFLIPQKLYGRENEVQTLMDAFERVSAGTSEMMLVSGYSGIGKTSVVNEVHKPIVGSRGYFIAGKFDQFKRNIPYAALIQAFQELIRQLLTESPEQIEIWKQKLEAALASNGQVIIDVIPEVELIIGQQPELPQLGATESQNRFNRVFKQFIHVFTHKEHPLVLFLDDLQWADTASLKLLQLLITDSDSQYLLLIGAYRDNEVSPTHPLMLTLEEIEKTGATVNNIVLQPLELGHISQLVADTLQESERSKDLAELVFNKTQGNPFFLTQLLQTFHAEKLVYFDFVEGRWLWDIEQIQAIGITDYSVVELVAKNIQKLSEETEEVLKLAACVGNSFTLDVLAIVNEKSLLDTANDLWEALQSGLILPLSNTYKIPLFFDSSQPGGSAIDDYRISYKFLHDRVQQAAYSLIPEERKKATHLKIGQLLLQKTAKLALEENIFDIVNQLNIGVEFLQDPLEKEELASLNLMAGKKAKMANAYEGAVRYLTVGLELLPENSWQSHYELTLNLHVEAVEAEYLNTSFERAEILAEIVLQQATNLLDKVKVYELKIQFYIAQNQMLQAIQTGFSVVEMLGIPLAVLSNDQETVVQLPQIEDLESIPDMTDPYQLAAMRIFMNIAVASVITNPAVFVQVILTMVNLCIKHGHSALAAFAYVDYGMILCGSMGKLEAGYFAGQLALKLLEKFNAQELKSKVYAPFNGLIRHWKEPARETLLPLQEAIQTGLETGDIEYAGVCAFHYSNHVFWIGEPLESVAQKQAAYIDLMVQLKQDFFTTAIKLFHQFTLNLQGVATDKCRLVGQSFDENIMLPYLQQVNNSVSLWFFYIYKSILFYLFKNYKEAIENASLALTQAGISIGLMTLGIQNFYYSLALLAQYKQATPHEQQQYLIQVEANQQKMQFWAENAPANYQHKYDLVEAEKARVLGDTLLAMELYDRAITGAKNNGYIQEEALANEIAAEFYLACGRINIAKSYMTEAYYGYIRWGAIAKVKDLDERYSQLIFRAPKTESSFFDTTRTTTSSTGSHTAELDLSSVIKASQAISGEIVLENLIDKLMKIVIENAGAQRGCLLARQNNQWVITAQGTVADKEITITHSLIEEIASHFPLSLLNYVERTKQHLVLDNATSTKPFATDPYIVSQQSKSVLCLPIIHQGKLDGILYLENNLTTEAFTSERVKVLKLLTAQASISLENARLYTNLQDYSQKLEAKSSELEVKNVALVASEAREREKAEELKQSLHKLQQTQAQLVHTEKISSLGQLVAGVAHEVNNPVSFIVGNLHHATQHVRDLLSLIDLYAKHLPEPPTEIQDEIEVIELEYLKEDLPKMLSSMQVGTDRIKDIMQSLRNFSRVDEAEKKSADIHSGIESTLMILQHRLKAKKERPAIVVVKEYGKVPPVECYAGQLNQVFMNLLANAIDAMDESNGNRKYAEIEQNPNRITIRTQVEEKEEGFPYLAIHITDNGPGIPEVVQQRLFTPFFTTKPTGKGTGLGLSISYQIVVEKHHGNLRCVSAPGQGTTFIIEIPMRPVK